MSTLFLSYISRRIFSLLSVSSRSNLDLFSRYFCLCYSSSSKGIGFYRDLSRCSSCFFFSSYDVSTSALNFSSFTLYRGFLFKTSLILAAVSSFSFYLSSFLRAISPSSHSTFFFCSSFFLASLSSFSFLLFSSSSFILRSSFSVCSFFLLSISALFSFILCTKAAASACSRSRSSFVRAKAYSAKVIALLFSKPMSSSAERALFPSRRSPMFDWRAYSISRCLSSSCFFFSANSCFERRSYRVISICINSSISCFLSCNLCLSIKILALPY
jgi:hypothetical protein